MIWIIIFLSFLAGWCFANATYFSDMLAKDAMKQDLGPYAGWRKEKK